MMKKTALFIFCILGMIQVLKGQYTDTDTDTASMRIIEQNKLAKEGDLYLDTIAKIYKIGLTNGKLGLLSDNQSIDSLRVSNDSLFVFISGGNSSGIPLDSIQKEVSDSGLQYYTWDISNTSQPDIDNVRELGVSTTQGRTTAPLDNTLRGSVAPDTQGYILCFKGKIKVKNTGVFNFNARSDDGSRIYIDDVLVLENWFNQGATTRSNSVTLAKGEHTIEFWYYEDGGADFMEFTWGINPDGYPVGSSIDSKQLLVK